MRFFRTFHCFPSLIVATILTAQNPMNENSNSDKKWMAAHSQICSLHIPSLNEGKSGIRSEISFIRNMNDWVEGAGLNWQTHTVWFFLHRANLLSPGHQLNERHLCTWSCWTGDVSPLIKQEWAETCGEGEEGKPSVWAWMGWGRGRQTVYCLFAVILSHKCNEFGLNPKIQHQTDLHLFTGTVKPWLCNRFHSYQLIN